MTSKHKQTKTFLKRKVFVGLSGGVDSSVSAALLKQATPNNFEKLFGRPTPKGFRGYDVTGVFIKVWHGDTDISGKKRGLTLMTDANCCQAKDDRLDAMRVCAKLDIPFIELNLEKEYKKEVVDYMIREYKAGKTPNPDVMCNRYVKFGAFYEWARAQGADFVATGHYARVASDATREVRNPKSEIRNKSQISNSKLQTTNYKLLTGSDQNKDQSYFLWQIRQEQLPHILFPVGGMLKQEVRKLAKKFGFITAEKKDSQGLCFVGKVDMKEFLKHYIKPKRGKILNENGKEIGWHDGVMFFTLGERHCFTVGTVKPQNHAERTRNDAERRVHENQKPYYVIAKDIKKNTLTVSHDPKMSVHGDSRTVFEIGEVNWLGPAPATGARLLARLRYRQPIQEARVYADTRSTRISADAHRRKSALSSAKISVRFTQTQTGGAAGQSIVFYEGEVCLGGGTIR